MIENYMYDYKNQAILNRYDERFEKSYIKEFLLYTLFNLFVPEGKIILDCPGSTGYLTNILIQKGAKYVICSDIVKEQLEYAKIKMNKSGIDESKYCLICHDAKNPKLLKQEVDIAIVIHLFCFANDFEEILGISNFLYMNMKSGGKLFTFHCTPIKPGKEKLYEETYNAKIIELDKRNEIGKFIVTEENGFTLPRNMYDNKVIIEALKLVGFHDIKYHRFEINPSYKNQKEISINHDICDYYFIEATK